MHNLHVGLEARILSNASFMHTSPKLPCDSVKMCYTVFGLNNWSTDNDTSRPDVRPGPCVVRTFYTADVVAVESRDLMQSVEILPQV